MVALVGLGDQFVDLAIRNLRQDAIAFADGQQDRIQHFVDALHDFAIHTLELIQPASLGEPPLARRVHQPHDLLGYVLQLSIARFLLAAFPIMTVTMPVATVASSGAVDRSVFQQNFSRHNFFLLE